MLNYKKIRECTTGLSASTFSFEMLKNYKFFKWVERQKVGGFVLEMKS
jgi:hypothetical protein